MLEIWKDIKQYEGLYQVSNLGRVRSLGRKINTGRNGYRITQDKILKQYNKVGYNYVMLYNKSGTKALRVHRLVAEAFIPNPENKPQVNHLNENKQDNTYTNLIWATSKENCNYGSRNQRILRAMKPKNIKAFGQKVLCVELGIVFDSIKSATRFCGRKNISDICACLNHRNGSKTAYGYHWERIGIPAKSSGWRLKAKIA